MSQKIIGQRVNLSKSTKFLVMNTLDKKIIDFIDEHHVLTLAVSENNFPYCANCFYTYDEEALSFIFSTDLDTKHGKIAHKNPNVSGVIVLETKKVGKIQGIQFTGTMKLPTGEEKGNAEKKYLSAYPFAKIMKTTIWVLKINFIKFTDNRLGFGKKLIWNRDI